MTRLTVEERFWAKVDRAGGPDACWLWMASKNLKGYGVFSVGRRGQMAHRWSYEHHVGPIPDGMLMDHTCMRPDCVNPAHLEPVSPSENVRRGYAPSVLAAWHRAKTHCPQGHPYDAANTYVYRGHRHCRACMAAAARRRRVKTGRKVVTHCPYGHAYDDENTYWNKGKRFCRACAKRRDEARRAKRKTQAKE